MQHSLLLTVLFFSCQKQSTASEENYVLAHWDFNALSGDVLNDISGNGHDGIIQNPQWTSGVIDGALEFKEGNSCVTIPYSHELQPKEEFTLESVVLFKKLTFFGGEPIITNNYNGGLGLWSWMGLLNIWINIAGQYQSAMDVKDYEINKWYHLAGTYDGSKLQFYVNYNLVQELDVKGSVNYSVDNALQIAKEATSSESPGYRFFTGIIDEIRFTSRRLSTEEFLQK